MQNAYNKCSNLRVPICGPNVMDMSNAYSECSNLTFAVCNNKVTNMSFAFYGCGAVSTYNKVNVSSQNFNDYRNAMGHNGYRHWGNFGNFAYFHKGIP
jgi:hypothetical protein